MCFNNFFNLFFILCLSTLVSGLYEDQIGKFDWKKNLIGAVKYSLFPSDNHPRDAIFVATEENLIASLSSKSGEIIWRKVLEKGDRGSVNAICSYGSSVFAVTGSDVVLVRGWDAKHGYLSYHWSSQYAPSSANERVSWFCNENKLHRLYFESGQPREISTYKLLNGEKVSSKDINSEGRAFSADSCVVSKMVLLCVDNLGVSVMNLSLDDLVFQNINIELDTNKHYLLRALSNSKSSTFIIENDIKKFSVILNDNLKALVSDSVHSSGDIIVHPLSFDPASIVISVESESSRTLKIKGYKLGGRETEFSHSYNLKASIGDISVSAVECSKYASSHIICSLLLTTTDGSLIFLKTNGELEWVREESLASIVTAEMIELPMSDTEAEMQAEFEAENSDVFSAFSRRISGHAFQLQKLLMSISGYLEKSFSHEPTNDSKFERDYFNLHKIILVITKQLKIFAIDNVSKSILWSYLVDKEFESFSKSCSGCDIRIPLFIQRTHRHYPHPMQCTIFVRNKETKNGVIMSFNPVTGQFDPAVRLNYRVKQAVLLPRQTSEDYLQGIMILSEENTVHVYPERAKSVMLDIASSLFVHVAEADTCEVNGFTFGSSSKYTSLEPAWNMKCTGKIIKVSSKNPIEKVHSQGRVLADRSVLYKYINPNLIVIVSQSINPEDQKSMLTLYFVDSVTGVIVNGDVRHRASDPVHLIHSENWIVLMYFNDKARRTEVVTYELYEGKTQKNSTAFSSVQAKNLRPIVDSRAYILPTSCVEAAKETITEKGITSKHVLAALSTGNVVELPWMILDPRRPFAATPETREEGVLPYMPEIPIPTETIINYNQTLHRVRGILTSPSGLESTSLIFVYGLDLFYTRTAPSKTFDLLKEDFDYMLIIIVLVLLIFLTFLTKHLAYRRALRQAWR